MTCTYTTYQHPEVRTVAQWSVTPKWRELEDYPERCAPPVSPPFMDLTPHGIRNFHPSWPGGSSVLTITHCLNAPTAPTDGELDAPSRNWVKRQNERLEQQSSVYALNALCILNGLELGVEFSPETVSQCAKDAEAMMRTGEMSGPRWNVALAALNLDY